MTKSKGLYSGFGQPRSVSPLPKPGGTLRGISDTYVTEETPTAPIRYVHEIKCEIEPYRAILAGRKTWEFRNNDRGYLVGDMVLLREFDGHAYTGRENVFSVAYILHGPAFGIPSGYCCFSLGKP